MSSYSGTESFAQNEEEIPFFSIGRSRPSRALVVKSSKVIDNTEKRKAGLQAEIKCLKGAVNMEITQAKTEFFIVFGSLIVTIMFTLVAKVWSDASGTITTFITGVSTTGIIGSTSGSLQSYFSLKTDLGQDLLEMEGLLSRDPPDCEATAQKILELREKLHSKKNGS